jgi:hypothetical protein
VDRSTIISRDVVHSCSYETRKTKKQYRDIYRDVTLRISGKTLNPEDITKKLRLEPTGSCTRGYEILKSGRKRYLPEGKWYFSIPHKDNVEFEERLRKLAELIRPRRKELKAILRKYGAELDISVQPNKELAMWGYIFRADILNEFISLGISLTIHIWNC